MPAGDHDRERLRRALALAAKGRFRVEPNPSVGCVIEQGGRVVGEGWHGAYGGPHAEVAALVRAGDGARGAAVYVSLEPCSRPGKTGPCSLALADAGVARVVYAATDPNEAGEGAASLARAGIAVEGPLLEAEGRAVLGPFLRARASRRPWVVLKWALTLDGRSAEAPGRGGRITGPLALADVHALRAHADAVMVGVETVLADDPRLTARPAGALPRPPAARVVLDSTLRTPPTARLLEDLPAAPLLLYATRPASGRRRALEDRGAVVVEVASGPEGRVDLRAALADLRTRGVGRLLVEGGARLHGALLREGLADQVAAYVAPVVLGEAEAPGAVAGAGFETLERAPRLEAVRWRRLGEDLLLEGYLPACGPDAPLSG